MKKKIVVSILLALVLIFALTTTAFAASSTSYCLLDVGQKSASTSTVGPSSTNFCHARIYNSIQSKGSIHYEVWVGGPGSGGAITKFRYGDLAIGELIDFPLPGYAYCQVKLSNPNYKTENSFASAWAYDRFMGV